MFAGAVAGLAILGLIHGDFAPLWAPFPAGLARPQTWAYGLGALLLAAGAGSCFARTARASTLLIAVCLSAWAAARARPLLLEPRGLGNWYGLSEALGPSLGAWILYAALPGRHDSRTGAAMAGDRALRAARALFGAACVGYGAAHFGYAALTAAMVPAWLPGRMALAYLTGAAHAAAGLGLLVGVLPRLAATLEAVMMSLFGVMVWLPSLFAQTAPEWAPSAKIRWSETLLTFLLAGSAWIVAASLRSSPWGFAPRGRDGSHRRPR